MYLSYIGVDTSISMISVNWLIILPFFSSPQHTHTTTTNPPNTPTPPLHPYSEEMLILTIHEFDLQDMYQSGDTCVPI